MQSLDDGIATLTNLKSLQVQWIYTAGAFLQHLSTMTSLKSLVLVGAPLHTPAASFLSALEFALPALKKLELQGDLTSVTIP